jgi:GT2 family glycosyltransferase
MSKVRVSVIIVNYNGQGLIIDCLKALERQSFKDFRVVMVDNGSSDGSLDEIRIFLNESLLAPVVKLIPLGRNLGFAGGNLEGLKHACGEYIALLNNDAAPDKNWLGELVVAMDSDPMIGICASKLIAYGSDIIDSAGDGFSTSLKGFKRGAGEKTFLYNQREFVFGACAGGAIYRRKMIEEIGFLDEDFFLIHEDTDLNFRAQLHGWKVMYVPTAIVYHKVGSSIGKMSPMAVYYSVRNSALVKIKNIPLSLFLRCLPVVILGMVSEFIYIAVRHRHPILYFKAKIDAIRMLRVMLKKRSANLKGARVDSKGLREIITPVFEGNFLRKRLKKLFFE